MEESRIKLFLIFIIDSWDLILKIINQKSRKIFCPWITLLQPKNKKASRTLFMLFLCLNFSIEISIIIIQIQSRSCMKQLRLTSFLTALQEIKRYLNTRSNKRFCKVFYYYFSKYYYLFQRTQVPFSPPLHQLSQILEEELANQVSSTGAGQNFMGYLFKILNTAHNISGEEKQKFTFPDYLLRLNSQYQDYLNLKQIKLPKTDLTPINLQQTQKTEKLICCLSAFDRDLRIEKKQNGNGSLYFIETDLTKNGLKQCIPLASYFCSVSNNGGGTILFGFKREGQHYVIAGLKHEQNLTIVQREKIIIESIKMIKPEIEYMLDPVYVKNKTKHDEIKVCLRLKILPKFFELPFYVQINQNFPVTTKLCHIFFFDRTQPAGLPKNEYYYKNIIKDFNKRKRQFNKICFGTKCLKYDHWVEKQIHPPFTFEVKSTKKIKGNKEKKVSDEPFVQFPNSSLLILQFEKNEVIVEQFLNLLKKNISASSFSVKKPFQEVLVSVGRSVWQMSHKLNFSGLKNLEKKYEKDGKLEKNLLTLMPVYRKLEIQRSKLSLKNEELIKNKMEEHFSRPYQMRQYDVQENDQIIKMVQFEFLYIEQSIFCYLLLQSLKLRAYFTKNGNIHSKQPQVY